MTAGADPSGEPVSRSTTSKRAPSSIANASRAASEVNATDHTAPSTTRGGNVNDPFVASNTATMLVPSPDQDDA